MFVGSCFEAYVVRTHPSMYPMRWDLYVQFRINLVENPYV